MDKYKKLKTDFTEESQISISSVDPELHNQINRYINLVNSNKEIDANKHKFNVRDYILNLIEKDLNELVLDNTFIELDRPLYFNKRILKETGVVKTTNVLYGNDLEETIVIEKTPNNLDIYNSECRSYCQEDMSSIHAGIYIIPNLNGGEDYFLNLLYDSDKEIITIRLFQDIDVYFNNEDKEQLEIKEKLLSDVEKIKRKYNDETISINDLAEYAIMYNYINHKKLSEKDPHLINSKSNGDVNKKNLFEYMFKGLLFKDF